MRRKFRHDNAFKFSHRDAETAVSFQELPVGVGLQCHRATPARRESRALDLLCPDYLGPVEAWLGPESNQACRLQSATSR